MNMYVCMFLSFATPPEKTHQYLLKEIKRKKRINHHPLAMRSSKRQTPDEKRQTPAPRLSLQGVNTAARLQ